jgi:predicted Zn-dependent peptidase
MQHATLSNGLRVVTVPLHDTKAVTIFVFAKVGSRHETRRTNGIAHFIEHLMFKGTKKRPTTLSISRLLDGVGAGYNAFTSKDWTGYYVKINAEHTTLALDVVSDMLRNSLFDPKEIERERGVIVEEINMYEDNPLMSIDDVFERAVFGDHHPLGWNIAGPRKVIREVDRATLLRFRNRFYHAKNMWVVVAGRMAPDIHAQIKRYFQAVRAQPTTPVAIPYRAGSSVAPIQLKWKEAEQVQLAVGMRAMSYTDRRLPAASVLATLLGGTMSSRLFIQVRERRGLAYSVRASVNPYEDTGSFMVQAGLEKTRVPEALRVILAELTKTKTAKVSAVELKRTKENLRGKMILELEDSDSIASWYGRQALFHKKIESPEQAMKKISQVTASDLQAIARQLFRPANMRLAIIGPFKDSKPFAKILRGV